eukprot:4306697-Prymnesium_polylepis.1
MFCEVSGARALSARERSERVRAVSDIAQIEQHELETHDQDNRNHAAERGLVGLLFLPLAHAQAFPLLPFPPRRGGVIWPQPLGRFGDANVSCGQRHESTD